MVGQYGSRGTLPLQNLEGSTMENAPAGITSSDIRYFAKLVVDKHIRSSLHSPILTWRFLQEQALDGFIQGEQPILRGQLSNLAESLEGEVLVQDRACRQEFTTRGRELGQAKLDHLTHVRREHGIR